MRPERLAEIDALLEAALDIPLAARSRLLDERSAGDPELRREVERLLALAGGPDDDLLTPVRRFAALAGQGDGLAPGDTVGAYTLVRPLGEGGMGVVFLAARTDGTFEREVALKLLPESGGDPAAVRAFEQERQILARLNHPHIAHLLDGGIDRRGLPYLVMEHVEGEPIDRYCDARRLPLAERLRLVVAIAGAVQAAHRNLVVHRDLKPSNVLVTAAGEVKLLDFGIARLLDPQRAPGGLTEAGRQPLTPVYASPEQVAGEPVTTASDVYQLGLLLYELVTGIRPQEGRTSSLVELVERVCKREPPAPSRAVLADAANGPPTERARLRHSTPGKLARALRPEVDAIVARCLAKDPELRYPTPAELAEDLQRYLAGRPVHARRASTLFRSAKWLRRNPLPAAAAAVLLLSTLAYVFAVTLQARAIERQRQRAELEATTASEVEQFVLGLFQSSDPDVALGREATARDLLTRGLERVERELASQPAVQARMWGALGEIYGQLGDAARGRELVERALARQQALYGERHIEVALSRKRLGVLLRLAGEARPAVVELEAALALRRELAPGDSPELARNLAELGIARRASGDLDGAESAFRESLDVHRRRGSATGIAVGLNNLGSMAFARGDLAAAEALYTEALAANRRAYGERHPQVALNLFNLGSVLRRRHRAGEAVPYFEQALTIDTAIYGAGHPTAIRDQLRLALAQLDIGDLGAVEAALAELLPRQIAAQGALHPQTAEARLALGQLRLRQGRSVEAEAEFREAISGLESHFGATHYRIGQVLLWLGRSLAAQGRRDESIAAWRAGLPTLRPGLNDETIAALDEELARAGSAPGGR